MEELGDEDVHLQNIGDILVLNVSQYVHEPLEAAVGRCDPKEVHLQVESKKDGCIGEICSR